MKIIDFLEEFFREPKHLRQTLALHSLQYKHSILLISSCNLITRYHEILHSSPYAGFGNGRHGLRVSLKKKVYNCHVTSPQTCPEASIKLVVSANFSVVKLDCIADGSERPSMERMDSEMPELSILYSVLASSLFQLRPIDAIDQCN